MTAVRSPHARQPIRWLVALAALLGLLAGPTLSAPVEAAEAPFLVGTGSASTSPLGSVCIGGYGSFCTRPSVGERDPLTARGLAISNAEEPDQSVIIVTATAVGLFAAYKDTLGPNGIDAARSRIAARTGLDPHQVVIVSDHSHAGPDTIGIWGGVGEAYMSLLTDGIVNAGVAAFEDRQPATLSWSAFDAREHGYALDSSYDAGPTDDEAMDNEFRVLFADGVDGQRIATFVNYAPHATVCGDCGDQLTGDWTAWVDEVARERLGWDGMGFGAVGVLGATDWNKVGSDDDEKVAEAKDRLEDLLNVAEAQATPVVGNEVLAQGVFIREPIAQPVLMLNYFPGLGDPTGNFTDGEIRIDRSIAAPYHVAGTVGTWGGAIRIGDLFWSLFPGEPFPQLQDALRDTVEGASAHFLLGAANDFLGYMTADPASYQQTLEEGALFLAGCPEEELYDAVGHDHDGACPDHWTLMVSPVIGTHLACTAQDLAAEFGFTVSGRDQACAGLTVTDGLTDPFGLTSAPVARTDIEGLTR